jgi:hypothetical protein
MHQATKIIPLVHATHVHTIAHTERHSFGQIDVVCDQQATSIANVDDESLVSRAIIIIRQQASNEASNLYPATVIVLLVGFAHPMPFIVVFGADTHRVPQKTRQTIFGLPRSGFLLAV